MNKTLYLIDGHAVVYRYYYAFERDPLITSRGLNTGATWGMAKIVTTLLMNYPVTHIGVIFDPPYKTWRKDFYPQYKANREHADDMTPQLDMTYHMLKTWGIFTAAYKPLEADDVLGILARRASEAGYDVVIVTKDKDMAQLVNGSVKLLDLGKAVGKDKATFIDREDVKQRYGVYPEQIPDYLALMGDASDNVPGVKGIGKKAAPELLAEYGTIKGIYENLDKLTKSKKANFEAAVETIKRDRKLVTLSTQYEIPVDLDKLARPPLHNTNLFELFEGELEFHSIIKELSTSTEPVV